MVKRWKDPKGRGLVLGCMVAATLAAAGCGESTGDGDEGSGGGASGSSSGGSDTGGSTTTGGSGGSTSTGGASGAGGSGGSTSDPCGGCAAQELCIVQAGGPGPGGRLLCAENPICRSGSICGCIQNQGDCMVIPAGSEMAGMCQCDNGLE